MTRNITALIGLSALVLAACAGEQPGRPDPVELSQDTLALEGQELAEAAGFSVAGGGDIDGDGLDDLIFGIPYDGGGEGIGAGAAAAFLGTGD